MNSPAIRFAGFTEDWEQRKLFDAIKKIIDFRGRTPKKIGLDWSESGYLALSALNVKDGYIDITADANFGSQELYDRWMDGHELRKGQVLFTTEAPMGNVAQVPDNAGYILSQRTIAFDVDPEIIIEDFLFTLLRSPNMFRALSALSSGGTAKGVSQKSMSQIDTIIPKNLEEQTQLAAFFISLDRLITLHQREHDKTVNIKKALLEKMLPKDGEDKPEIRFAGFTGAWEQREFAELVSRVSTMSDRKYDMPRVEYEDIISGQGQLNKNIYEKQSNKRGIHFEPGDILFGKLRPYLQNWLAPDFTGIAVGDWWVLKPQGVNTEFICALLQSPQYQRVSNLSTGTKMPRSDWSVVARTTFAVPSQICEQAQIGKTFTNIDRLIALHQRELTKLQNIKKALLEKMFV